MGKFKTLIGSGLLSLVATFLVALPAGATPQVVGNWHVQDHGQGCWGGGNLLVDGTGNGGGNCSFSTGQGQEVADLDPVSWSFTDSTDTAVNLCANITGRKGPVYPVGIPILSCIVVPVGTTGPVSLGGGTFGWVNIH